MAGRFVVQLRERQNNRASTYDRWWTIRDTEQRGFKVAEIHASFPEAEQRMRSYCLNLNQREELSQLTD